MEEILALDAEIIMTDGGAASCLHSDIPQVFMHEGAITYNVPLKML